MQNLNVFKLSVSLIGASGFGLLLVAAPGCMNSATGSNGGPPGGHAIGYQDTPPVATPPSAPGTPKTNDSTNPLPPGGVTVQPKVVTPDENSSGTMQNRTSSP